MRGPDVMQDTLFSVRNLESYVPAEHPLRPVRDILNEALKRMDPLFAAMYAPAGRDSIAPEKLLRALMLQVLYGVRSERMLIEQLGYNLLFRWFVGVAMQDDPWDHSTFSKNRDRLIAHDACAVLFEEVLAQARAKGLLSTEHFSVDGTLDVSLPAGDATYAMDASSCSAADTRVVEMWATLALAIASPSPPIRVPWNEAGRNALP